METRNVIDDVRKDGAHDEGVAGHRKHVGQLYVELPVVVVDPATVDDAGVHTIKTDDVVGTEEGVGHQAEHATYGVFGEHIHSVVDSDQEFDCRIPSVTVMVERSAVQETYS